MRAAALEHYRVVDFLRDGADIHVVNLPRAALDTHFFAVVPHLWVDAVLAQPVTAEELEQRLQLAAAVIVVGMRTADDFEHLLRSPALVKAHADNRLRQHVGRFLRNRDAVNLARVSRIHQHRALDEVVRVGDDEAPLRNFVQRVAGAADALQPLGDGLGRANLHHQVDVADVNPELERGRGDDCVHLALLQFLLDVEPHFLRHRAVVRRQLLDAALLQLQRDRLGAGAGVGENQRRAVVCHEVGQQVIHVRIDDLGRVLRQVVDRAEHAQVEVLALLDVDDVDRPRLAARPAAEVVRDFLNRRLRRREANAHRVAVEQVHQPFDRE